MSTIQPVQSGLCLRVVEGSHSQTHHPLTRSVISVGRATPETPYSSAYLTFPEATVSRLHIVLTWEPGASAYMVHHRSQTNPTLLNGQVLATSTVLKLGDVLACGRLVLVLESMRSGDSPAAAPPEPQRMLLNIRKLSDESGRVFSVPLERAQFSLHFSSHNQGINPEETSELDQVIHLPAEQEAELSFTPREEQALVELGTPSTEETVRTTSLVCGKLQVPLKVGQPIGFGPDDALSHQGYHMWLAESENQLPHSKLVAGPDSQSLDAQEMAELRFLNGAWKGGSLSVPIGGAAHFDLGPGSTSFRHRLPLTGTPTCSISIQDGRSQLRVCLLSDDQFLDVNGELLFTGESLELFSGSTILLGESEFFWSVPKLHKEYTQYSILDQGTSHPIEKAEIRLGTAAHCEVQIRERGLAPVVGVIKYTKSGFVYKHLNIACTARIDGSELSSGLESPITLESILELAPGINVRLQKHS